jgi:hypothetical protein
MTNRLKEGELGNRGNQMKKFIVLVAFACAFGALVGRPSADVSLQAAVEPAAMLATMQASQSLKTEAYQAI